MKAKTNKTTGIRLTFLLVTVMLSIFLSATWGTKVYADTYERQFWNHSGSNYIRSDGVRLTTISSSSIGKTINLDIYGYVPKDATEVRLTSSDTDVLEVVTGTDTNIGTLYSYSYEGYVYDSSNLQVKVKKAGVSKLTFQAGDLSYPIWYFVRPAGSVLKSVKPCSQDSCCVVLRWNTFKNADGFYICRKKASASSYTLYQTITDGSATSCHLQADFDVKYEYAVIPYVTLDDGTNEPEDNSGSVSSYNGAVVYTLKHPEYTLTMKTSGQTATVSWNSYGNEQNYILYKASSENGSYTKVSTTTNTSCKVRLTKGFTYYFKLKVNTADYTVTTDPQAVYVPKSTSKSLIRKSVNKNVSAQPQYTQSWSSRSATYYYKKGTTLHFVAYSDKKLTDYTLNASGKVKSKKTVKLGSLDIFGGFYYGTDGKYYVAVGYGNKKERDGKTVIKVYQYNSSWGGKKTAIVKGGISNSYKGIYYPFDFGNCRMEMTGKKLYVYTCRLMYAVSGVNHQSNIAFSVNTTTMKAKAENYSYVSHSFNQFVKYSSGNLYLLDHGDAYPRGVKLSIVHNYGTTEQSTDSSLVVKASGTVGNNWTGLELGGMEVGTDNVLITGISVPQGYKVAGVKGAKTSYKKNVFLVVADKETGKSKIKWLTTYNPKKSSVTVSGPSIVKIDDNRFAILYSTTSGKKYTLHYALVNNAGKVLVKKTYSGIQYCNATEPVVQGGRIYIYANRYKHVKKVYYGKKYYYDQLTPYEISIPVALG